MGQVAPATAAPAVFDTSVFIGREGRGVGTLAQWAPIVSVITIAELRLGVRLAKSDEVAAQRSAMLADAMKGRIVPIDVALIAEAWCTLRVALKRKISANDSWIAATALALGVPIVTQDDDFNAASELLLIERI
jgi:predicted nucleic acid-binding protein